MDSLKPGKELDIGSLSGRRRIVIIGLGTGGLFASKAASNFDRDSEITIIERRYDDMFSPCGLPYAIEGKVKSFEDLKHSIPETRQIKTLMNHEALSIDTEFKRVEAMNLSTLEIFWVDYDSLIISTGSRPAILPIPGAKEFLARGLHVVAKPEDAMELKEAALKGKRAVVVGGGAIGLEIAIALKELGLDVYVTKRSPPPFPRNLDADMGEIVRRYLESKGLRILFGKKIERIIGSDQVESVEIDGEIIQTDIVVMAVGGTPESGLAVEAGIAHNNGAIITNERMETSVEDVYAIGDCVLSFSGVDNKPVQTALATTTFREAVVAGINAAGGEMVYDGCIGTFVSCVGDLEIASTGYNSRIAEKNGFKLVTGRANMQIKPAWMPGAKEISVKLVVDSESGRILGGQAVGEEGAAWRVNIVALAIKTKMSIEEFRTIELAYCPAVSNLYDPLLVAADTAFKRFNRKRMIDYSKRIREERMAETPVVQRTTATTVDVKGDSKHIPSVK